MPDERGHELEKEIDRLVDECRSSCLWFLRPDYYPSDDTQRDRVLLRIEQNGDRATFQRAAELRRWLSLRSSGKSAAS
ncbi:hypothetical protein FBQ97_17055 [Acidobacteria bacterium ACD]|nr:MAG: hypothetical protein EDX89_09285 [Acidobacteriota bacterium]MCE7957867.1 hypothetical protein [Acidobacteria bacterium ACB2]MDL1951505.1 hypothetical protein [Acidobacteria bacterium ACD]